MERHFSKSANHREMIYKCWKIAGVFTWVLYSFTSNHERSHSMKDIELNEKEYVFNYDPVTKKGSTNR